MSASERATLLSASDGSFTDVEGETRRGNARTGANTKFVIGALSAALLASVGLNATQYANAMVKQNAYETEAALGSSRFAVEAPRGLTKASHDKACGHAPTAMSLMCVGERDTSRGAWRSMAALGQAAGEQQQPGASMTEEMQADQQAIADSGAVNLASAGDGNFALHPASGSVRYCRKDTWLLSCLFYKANINDEATDWKHVKEECDGEFECDGVNKYWTSDLWHIASSGNADGCDVSLLDGSGTDASAFYKEGSAGWHQYGPSGDGSCKIVNTWGNPE